MENLNDVTDAFDGWEISIAVLRKSPGSYVNGLWVEGAETTVPIVGVVQNANPDDMMIVPETLRTSEAIKIHTRSDAEIKTVDEVGETNADLVLWDNWKWRVYSVADRRIGGYYKAIAVRIKEYVS